MRKILFFVLAIVTVCGIVDVSTVNAAPHFFKGFVRTVKRVKPVIKRVGKKIIKNVDVPPTQPTKNVNNSVDSRKKRDTPKTAVSANHTDSITANATKGPALTGGAFSVHNHFPSVANWQIHRGSFIHDRNVVPSDTANRHNLTDSIVDVDLQENAVEADSNVVRQNHVELQFNNH